MEKVMSIEDKIRKAEEIYYRRRNQEIPVRETIKEQVRPKKNFKLMKRMIKQIIICLIIYSAFYMIINNNYIFSEDFTNKVREVLSQDINFAEIYSGLLSIINQEQTFEEQEPETLEQINDDGNTENTEKPSEEKNTENIEQPADSEKTKEEIQNNDENIGGAEEVPLSQMEQDANYIKSTINFIKPLEGTISSMFGLRNPTTESVPKNHTGTDIAEEKGTTIVSATDGTVIYAGSKGDFGKHIKIQINDVIVVYAHCNKLYVKEGDIIKQGQKIAEVGSTGNTTGPHLHFEIRYQERCVDPQLILEL